MQRSAYSIASSKGFPYIDTNGGEAYRGTFYNRFTKDKDKRGACLFVGFNHRAKRWELYYDRLPISQPT